MEHPAAKLMILGSQMQEVEVGDATNFVIIFAGALLKEAEDLLRSDRLDGDDKVLLWIYVMVAFIVLPYSLFNLSSKLFFLVSSSSSDNVWKFWFTNIVFFRKV